MTTLASSVATLLSLLLVLTSGAVAQEKPAVPADETVASIPVLDEFHEVIYEIWHTAWPEKDIAMLARLTPDVRRFTDSLAKVQLPGILRDREEVWRKNIVTLQSLAGTYEKCAAASDSAGLLDAAERLHAQYEALVRVTRPPLKEVEEFHQVLYMIYHHYLPGKDKEHLASSIPLLKEKMAVLDSVQLPERKKKVEAAFLAARTKLSASVAALDVSLVKGDEDALSAAVEAVHTDYQALERVFE
jgi:hypothetical protein